ncbi:MAG: UDPglucose 6-dehydrogenase [Parcubacteria bacterium C7867-004]|nr:MAG: UDPglucose 6-dehydrogenase [Parcubacteria bacterium C7867-004]
MDSLRIGFIGQGWIGKNYADDFEARGYDIVRYGLEPEYAGNREAIAECDIVFIAVPTPTTAAGFDSSIVRSTLSLVGKGKIAVLKSTLLPGTTEELHAAFPDIILMNSPEFLRESNAAHDAAHPERNLIGIPEDTDSYKNAAETVLSVLPKAPYARIMRARAAELTKYAGNVFLTLKVVYANMLYDLAASMDIPYEEVKDALAADPRIGPSHLSPVSASGHTDKAGRGAGGHCFIKDLEAFRRLYAEKVGDEEGKEVLRANVLKNNALLTASEKDLDLLEGVYGKDEDIA